MPTKNRREWVPKAIECFLRQTYEHRELLLLADGKESIADLLPAHDPRIRLMVSGWTLNVGAKRNILCAEARGEVIAHFDDDDYSAPGRLEFQIERLRSSGKAVHGFDEMKFTDGAQWWLYRGSELATSLVYSRAWWEANKFPDLNCGQDEHFSRVAAAHKQLVTDKDLSLMYATVHATNTSPRPVQAWKKLPGFVWTDGAPRSECAA